MNQRDRGGIEEELRARVRQQAAVADLGQRALAGIDLSTLMHEAMVIVARTLAVEYCKVLELLPDGTELLLRAGVGWQDGHVGYATVGAGTDSQAGYTLLSHAPVIVDDLRTETRFSGPPLLHDHRVVSGLSVIIPGQERSFGVLGAHTTKRRRFTQDDVNFLQAVANVLATAIERKRAEEALRESEERFRILFEHSPDAVLLFDPHDRDVLWRIVDCNNAASRINGYTREELIGQGIHLLSTGEPNPEGCAAYVERLRREGTIHNETIHRRKDGTLLPIEFSTSLITLGGQELVLGIDRDITERVQAYQMLEQRVKERTQEIERRRQVAEGLRGILAILNSNRTLDEILDHILAQACRLLGTDAGAVYCLQGQDGLLTIQTIQGLDADNAALIIPVGWGAIGQAVLQRRPVAVSNATSALPDVYDTASQYRALLAVPLIVKEDVYGAIALYHHAPCEFSEEEISLAVTFGDQAALAIENARLFTEAQGKAILEERQRLARDLHDSVTQAMYGVMLYAEAASRQLAAGAVATATTYLRELQDTAQEALQEMRLLLFELRPSVLEQEGLVKALQARLEAVEGRANLETEFNVVGENRPPPDVEHALYRIAQEALNNALKHAHAHWIAVSLQQEPHRVLLEITDDGIGFDTSTARRQGGLGLRGMAERVAEVGGNLTLESTPGVGTCVQVEVGLSSRPSKPVHWATY